MSKTKKLFSIALAILMCLQLSLIPALAEGEATEEPAVTTGKYTTADNLPAIYGAGESLDDFENVTLTDATKVSDTKTILFADQSYNSTKISTVDAATYGVYGTNAIKVSVAQPPSGFMIKVNNGGYSYGQKLKNKELAFYANLPSQTVTKEGTTDVIATYPDGYYGIFLISTNTANQFTASSETILKNYTVTYYFEDGTKLIKENQSGIYTYGKDGNVAANGFKGYISIDLTDTNASDNNYLFFKRMAPWEGKTLYFDDFRLVDSDVFNPYATIQDFEDVPAKSALKGQNYNDAGLWVNSSYDPDVNIVDTGAAQGKTSLQFTAIKYGTICMNLKLKSSTAHNGIAFYVSIPASGWYGTPKFTIGFSTQYNTSANESLGCATYTYYFEDGSTLVKYGDDGIYPYDKNGNITSGTGFTGYVSVYYSNNNLTDYPYLHITVPDSNSSALQQSKGYIYLDDFRYCDYNTVADMESGDAYYINDTAIPVQKAKEESTDSLSVMTKLATLGMARNADGIAAIRKVLLGFTTAAQKHNVNGDNVTADICDLVALDILSTQ